MCPNNQKRQKEAEKKERRSRRKQEINYDPKELLFIQWTEGMQDDISGPSGFETLDQKWKLKRKKIILRKKGQEQKVEREKFIFN